MNINLAEFKERYRALQDSLQADFLENPDTVEDLVLGRSMGVDALLGDIWRAMQMSDELCLLAVGGYGRGELHFHSDIDLLILIPNDTHDAQQKNIAKFLTFLWDVGLEVGHAVRDILDCVVEIRDLSVVTNLLESRFLLGEKSLFLKMKSMIKSSDWSSQSFLVEKQKEQHNRHLSYSNTAYNLEPNLRDGPGGLRDIQTVAWVAKWYFDVHQLQDLVNQSFLTQGEYDLLQKGQLFLWKVRFALHIIAKHREDRIGFGYQKELAAVLGYVDASAMAVERLMHDYYQTATKISRLNDILLQLLEDSVLHTQNLNPRFVIRYGYIQVSNASVFKKYPSAFIEIFLLIARHNYIRGIGVKTLRQMQFDIRLIDCNYYKKRHNNQIFIELLQQTKGVNKALKMMNRYGILERYIPAFGKIVGLMQYDLFHAYTVDQHTLFVVRNLRRFFISEFATEFTLCSEIAQTIEKPELLFLAALFHDIAKGRGGDHAKLGACDALDFCQHHQLSADDSALVAGLVEYHLLMSQTAQKQDLEDFEVIDKFTKILGSVQFLELLYLLTVADIRATKVDLWNDWKDALLKKLFFKAKAHLLGNNSGVPPASTAKKITHVKQAVLTEIIQAGYDIGQVEKIFLTLPKDYFLHYEVADIVWHLQLVIKSENKKISVDSRLSKDNVVDIFVCCEDTKGLFFRLLSIIEKLGLDIVNAKILTTKNRKAYNTISVLQDNILTQLNINQFIEDRLNQADILLTKPITKPPYRHFEHQMKVIFSYNKRWNLTQINLNMIDKQGLLSNIAHIFYQLDIDLINARITTFGERVEDIFFVCNSKNQPLNKAEKQHLKKMFKEKL